jgi:hypothetical protein
VRPLGFPRRVRHPVGPSENVADAHPGAVRGFSQHLQRRRRSGQDRQAQAVLREQTLRRCGIYPPLEQPAQTHAGDSVTFRAALEAIVIVSACPQDIVPINNCDPTAIEIELSVS